MRHADVCVGIALALVVSGCDKLFGLNTITGQPGTADGATDAAGLRYKPVQQKAGAGPNSKTLTVTLPALPTSGDVLVIVGANESSPLNVPTGGGVTTWMRAVESHVNYNAEIWYGITDGTSAAVTITDAVTGAMRMSLSEWSGLVTANLPDGSSANNGGSRTSSSMASAAVMPFDAPVLLIFGVSSKVNISIHATDSTHLTGGTWTELEAVTSGSVIQDVWYELASTVDTYTPNTVAGELWDAAIAGFRAMPQIQP